MDATVAKQGHPKGLYVLFGAEMWERFSYYGMRALLTLYMAKQLLYSSDTTYGIYAAYGALVYTTPLLGGFLADKILGYRQAIYLGGILMALGHFLMAIEHEYAFFSALALLILGNGFFKPNISSLVGSLYEEGDPRRQGGFTIFYMGINVGAFFAPLVCGAVGELIGWHWGFGLAGVGMVLGLINFWYGERVLKVFSVQGLPPDPVKLNKPIFAGLSPAILIPLASLLVVPLVALLMVNNTYVSYFLYAGLAISFLYLLSEAHKISAVQRNRALVVLILAVFSMMFWAFFEQAGSSLTLYTDSNVDRVILGYTIPASVFLSLNPLFIVALAPLFSMMWVGLAKRNLEPNTPVKFALALLQLGLGFGVFVWSALFADAGLTPVLFLTIGYLLHTTGELFLSPIGLSKMTELAPRHMVSLVMGIWFLSSAFAHDFGGVIAKLTSGADIKVTALKYDPIKGKFDGQDQFTVVVRDSIANIQDTLVVLVALAPNLELAPSGPTGFSKYASVQPGQSVELNLHEAQVDPRHDHSGYALISAPASGQLTADWAKGTAQYQADTTEGEVLIRYRVFDTREPAVSDTITYFVSVSTAPPSAVFKPTVQYTVPFDTVRLLGIWEVTKALSVSVPVYQLAANRAGRELEVKVLDAPHSGLAAVTSVPDPRITPARSLPIYLEVFRLIALIAVGAAVVLLLLSPLIQRMMAGIK